MPQKRELINLTIINNSSCNLTIPLFQNNVASINATTKYSWDITTADLSCGTGTLVVNSISYNLTFAPTLSGLLSSLNALNFGLFCSEVIGGDLFIYTIDDTNIYGNFDPCPSASTTTTTTTLPVTSTTTTTTTLPVTSTTTTTTAPPTSTTTTTTIAPPTSTTTTTTTAPPVGLWKLLNTSDDLDISGITIGGSSGVVTIGAFPSTPSTTIEGTTQLITIPSSHSLSLILVTSGTTGQTIKVTDSNGIVQTQVIPNPNSGDVTFTNVYFDASVQVLIECLSSTPTTTTTTLPVTSTTTTTTTIAPPPPTSTTTTTTTTTLAILNTFRVNNTSPSNSITLDVQIDSVQVISPTVIPPTTALSLTPQVNCAGFTSVTLEYFISAGYTPTSASFSNGSGTYTGSIGGGVITFTGVNLTPSGNQDLTVNP